MGPATTRARPAGAGRAPSGGPAGRLRALVDRRAGLRWMHLLLGAALLTPFQLLASTVLGVAAGPARAGFTPLSQLLALALALPLVAAAGLLLVARSLEGAMARILCGATGEILSAPADSWSARRRTSLWCTLHALLGAVTGVLSLAAPPAGVALLLWPLFDRADTQLPWGSRLLAHPWAPTLLGAALLALPVLCSAAAGRCLARLAPRLLGPTLADRPPAAPRFDRPAEHTSVARELHDSVGHALSVVGIQAAAAARQLGTDPAFAAAALAAIEEAAHEAVAELDHAIGLLRNAEERATRTLADLPALLERTRAAGTAVHCPQDGPEGGLGPGLAALPGAVSREAYRIVQEGLGNVLKHADGADVLLQLSLRQDSLEITMTNPLRLRHRPPGPGGSGLAGMRERARSLGGTCEAGPDEAGHGWRLAASLPLRGPA
ncbi:sensor histidine kinase [Kitasatospora sp. NPDC088134]|uniref:sensor histidine kinase n=1 Tax=Kitasatospora sp. NPDC088134 TaxID=3364071 RepID=UPI00380D7892